MKSLFFVFAAIFLISVAPSGAQAQEMPYWLPGSYYAYDPYSRTDCYLRVRRSGNTVLDIRSHGNLIRQKNGGYYPNFLLALAGERYTVRRNGNNIILTYLSGHHRTWLFRRE